MRSAPDALAIKAAAEIGRLLRFVSDERKALVRFVVQDLVRPNSCA